MQFMRKETDDKPILVDAGMQVTQAKWNPNGNVLAVCGNLFDNPDAKGVVQFYNPYGTHIRTLKVPSSTVSGVQGVTWEGFGLRIALAVDANILFANIQPEYMWAYFNNTLVFSFRKPERNDMCVMFWDT
jgi:WD repeat-containing protein 35